VWQPIRTQVDTDGNTVPAASTLRCADLVDSAISWLRPTLRFVRGTASMYARNTVMGSHTCQNPATEKVKINPRHPGGRGWGHWSE
jgi:hypothetical protein